MSDIRLIDAEARKVTTPDLKPARSAGEKMTDKLNATNDALPRWISVEERLPEKGVFVVVYYGHFIGNLMDVYMWDGECWRSCSGFLEDAENITHWMPLPEPPKEERKTDDT